MSKKAFGLRIRFLSLTFRFLFFTFVHLLKLSALAAVGFLATATILGSYMLTTTQALWSPHLGNADLLFPVKISVALGFCFLVIDMFRRILKVKDSGDVTGALAAILELLLTVGLILALFPSISNFFGKTMFVDLGENVLPWEVRVTATFAFLLPTAFLLISGASFVILLVIRATLQDLWERIEKWLRTESAKALAEKIKSNMEAAPSKQDSAHKPNGP